MKSLDIGYIFRLIEASELLSDTQKKMIRQKIQRFSVVDQAELQMLLEREQEIHKAYYDKIVEIRRKYDRKRSKIIQNYLDVTREDQESAALADLENALSAVKP